jgi:hypothetical protein
MAVAAEAEIARKPARQRIAPLVLLVVLLGAIGVWASIWWSTRPQSASLTEGQFVAGQQVGTPVAAGPDGTVWVHLAGPQYAVTHDGGKSFAEVDVLPGGKAASTQNAAWSVPTFDPADAKAQAVATLDANGHVALSADGGRTWHLATTPPVHGVVRAIAVRGRGQVIYAASTNAAARSADGGRKWQVIKLPRGVTGVDAIYAPLGGGNVRLVASPTTGIWLSTDGGRKWVRSQHAPGGTGAVFLPDPRDAKRLWVVLGGQLYASEDGGSSFGLTTAQNVTVLSRDPNSGRMFALTASGDVLASADGAHWGRIASGAEAGSLVASWGTLYSTVKGHIATLADRG